MFRERISRRIGATPWLIIQGVALIATGWLAGFGMTFVCLVGGYFQHHSSGDIKIGSDTYAAIYAAFFLAMIVWVLIAGRFAWRNRSWLGRGISAIAFIVFAIDAINVLRFAYPVCNAF